jgi:general L-amino acid transport system permease protein
MASTSPNVHKTAIIPFWRDVRVLAVIGQAIFMVMVLVGIGWLIRNFLVNAEAQGIRIGFDFLNTTAGFDIKEGIGYQATDTFGRALWVGLVNTIRVSFIGIILTTIVALVVGIARLSNNWLISRTAALYIEMARNVPLLVLLVFIYAVILKLPPVKASIQPFGWPIFLNQRGVALPGLTPTASFPIWLTFVVLAIILALVLWLIQSRQEEQTGYPVNKVGSAIVTFLMVVALGWFVATTFSSDQAMMVTSSRNIASFDDFETIFLTKIDRDALKELGIDQTTLDSLTSAKAVADLKAKLTDQLAGAKQGAEIAAAESEAQLASKDTGSPEIETLEEQLDILDEATITVCAVTDTPAEINAVSQLRQRNIPVDLESGKNSNEAGEAYAKGNCDLLAGGHAELAAERAILEDPVAHVIVPISVAPLVADIPAPVGFNIQGGIKLSPEFAALLAGLVIYTGAFAAEIVRGGILAISKGQSEAARALGLSEMQRLRLIILPQALRVIIPPMTNQYLNLAKNSSLAVAIGFPDLVAVGKTVMNQSGLAVQVILIFMVSYLILSLTISAFLNWYNRRVALVER